MIYGLIPVGGKGTRLSLPFSKEMLPQKHYDFYNPVINHTVEKMLLAGASIIYMVHGTEYKEDILKFYAGNSKILHIRQEVPSFAGVLLDFVNNTNLKLEDKIIFGLPDSIYDGNPFVEMLTQVGIVCGMFHSDESIKADRPRVADPQTFDVKSEKLTTNKDWFWGVLKFDAKSIISVAEHADTISEIGLILNKYNKTFVFGKDYVDLGTWSGYNKYISNTKSASNTEVEKKYDASNVDIVNFFKFADNFVKGFQYLNIEDTKDYYFTNDNPNIEFIRYRNGGSGKVERNANITIKNFNTSQLNRFELTIPVDVSVDNVESVLQFMSLMGAKFEFSVDVNSHIYSNDDFILVMYSFELGDETIKLIEIELKKVDFNLLVEFENQASRFLPGFNSNKTIKTSKFQIIKEHYDKNRS